jgi:peptidoglycan biosynthesis protein MviN/MurJ (putative lipid II flippase)
LPVYAWLARREQHLGLALASSIGIAANAIVLLLLLNRRTANREAGQVALFFLKVCIAAAGAGTATFYLCRWLEALIAWRTTLGAFEVLVIATSAGVLLMLVFARILRVRELDSYLKKLRFGAGEI